MVVLRVYSQGSNVVMLHVITPDEGKLLILWKGNDTVNDEHRFGSAVIGIFTIVLVSISIKV